MYIPFFSWKDRMSDDQGLMGNYDDTMNQNDTGFEELAYAINNQDQGLRNRRTRQTRAENMFTFTDLQDQPNFPDEFQDLAVSRHPPARPQIQVPEPDIQPLNEEFEDMNDHQDIYVDQTQNQNNEFDEELSMAIAIRESQKDEYCNPQHAFAREQIQDENVDYELALAMAISASESDTPQHTYNSLGQLIDVTDP